MKGQQENLWHYIQISLLLYDINMQSLEHFVTKAVNSNEEYQFEKTNIWYFDLIVCMCMFSFQFVVRV